MDTTAAATQAGVTVATIRTWCRRGVVAAAKVAGRWVIKAASLARRIALGRKPAMIDLDASYTWTTWTGTRSEEITITPKVSDRTTVRGRIVSIKGLAPLLADHINAITDDGDRGHTLTVLSGATIALRDQEPDGFAAGVTIHTRMGGRVATTYTGTPDLPVDVVLDLGERLHAQLI